jgi:hypothetical protein
VTVEILKQGYYVEPVMVSTGAATLDKNVGTTRRSPPSSCATAPANRS